MLSVVDNIKLVVDTYVVSLITKLFESGNPHSRLFVLSENVDAKFINTKCKFHLRCRNRMQLSIQNILNYFLLTPELVKDVDTVLPKIQY